ncbi:MAG: type II toxin-antitoxin system HicA family toxin [Agriterribacter sp.]
MRKIPRDISALELGKLIQKHYGYTATRQSGSHIRFTTSLNGQHHITIPNHTPIKLGTLSAILTDIANHLKKTKEQVMVELFG